MTGGWVFFSVFLFINVVVLLLMLCFVGNVGTVSNNEIRVRREDVERVIGMFWDNGFSASSFGCV